MASRQSLICIKMIHDFNHSDLPFWYGEKKPTRISGLEIHTKLKGIKIFISLF